MYKNILVPVAFDHDQSPDAALAVAAKLADKGARITLLHVMEEVPAYAIDYLPEGYMQNLGEAIEAELAALAAKSPGVTPALARGAAGPAILAWAEDNEADCIIIASHRPGLSDYFLGSTASRVVRHAKCAVHVLR
ncbi:MAG: universal stress protein [Phaeovulum sp.]|uniref:universal stress protein n=1 Tax=Phaeovulum sp. TaxID=2934796 RepID=UPI0027303062|nr:universal stress protein [Phaeovulum sp.]MDP2063847.1 universal stress protein [Phaeovulum sp.]MDP3859953.1 universal stress protein [Phaeovulum sp.]